MGRDLLLINVKSTYEMLSAQASTLVALMRKLLPLSKAAHMGLSFPIRVLDPGNPVESKEYRVVVNHANLFLKQGNQGNEVFAR